jgi:hypothetical protein
MGYHLRICPLGSAHTYHSFPAAFEMHPGSVPLLGCLVPSGFPLEFSQLFQIFAPSTWFLSWGREWIRMEPTLTESTNAIFAIVIALGATHSNRVHWFTETATNLGAIQKWLKDWTIKPTESNSVHVTFTAWKEACSPVHLSQQGDVKYLGVAPRQETYLAQTHIHQTKAAGNDSQQNILATLKEVKALYEQQNSHVQIRYW